MRISGKGALAMTSAVVAVALSTAGSAVAADGDLWMYGTAGTGDTGAQVMQGTNPAIAALGNGGDEAAYQSSRGTLANFGTAGTGDLAVAMAAGTSPAIAGLETGGWQIAVADGADSLSTTGAAGSQDFQLGLATATSPSIAGLVPSGYEIAFQDYAGRLWTAGTGGAGNTNLGMWAGTGPTIAASGNSYLMAFNANTLHLFTASQTAESDLGTTVASGTSPAIAQPSTGGDEIAYVNTAGRLSLSGSLANADTGLAVASGTSPAIAPLQGGGYEAAFQGANGDLWITGPSGSADSGLAMAPLTSPSIAGLAGGGYEAAIQARAAAPSSTSLTTPVPQPPPTRGHKRPVRAKVLLSWRWFARSTRLRRVIIKDFPRRATIRFDCRGPRCPHQTVRATRRTIARLKRTLAGSVYGLRDTLYVKVSATGYADRRVRITFRSNRQPVLRLL